MVSVKEKGTALQVMQELKQLGYVDTFEIKDKVLWNSQTDVTYAPSDVVLEATFRYEGGSNPDDMSILYVFRCNDGSGGYIMDAYGLNAELAVSTFFELAIDKRDQFTVMDDLPASKVLKITAQPKFH